MAPKKLSADQVAASDVVVTMGCGDACPVMPGKRYLDWELADLYVAVPLGEWTLASASTRRERHQGRPDRRGIRRTRRGSAPHPHPAARAGRTGVPNPGEIVGSFPGVTGPVGCAFPGIVISDRIYSAANLDISWIGVGAGGRFSEACGRPVVMINDADAAGLAEARFGAAVGRSGVVLVLTLGTGIGSALLHDGRLVPNTELGHLELGGEVIEKRASNRARKAQQLSLGVWTERLNQYLAHLDRLLSPDLVVIGGGISKRFDTFGPHLRSRADVIPAALRNNAGMVGAALWAAGSQAAQPSGANRR